MCFLLGNDFLPHFPAINIRTNGINILLDVYKKAVVGGGGGVGLISKEGIVWKNVKKMLIMIGECEEELLKNEYIAKQKYEKYKHRENTKEEKSSVLMSCPLIYRSVEKYICPLEVGWEKRYKKELLVNESVESVCSNYLEGLEWVYKYYIGERIWSWKYESNYAPLIVDVSKCSWWCGSRCGSRSRSRSRSRLYKEYSVYTQMLYVFPEEKKELFPKRMHKYILEKKKEIYPMSKRFSWAFSRYFWECSPILPRIEIEMLDRYNEDLKIIME